MKEEKEKKITTLKKFSSWKGSQIGGHNSRKRNKSDHILEKFLNPRDKEEIL